MVATADYLTGFIFDAPGGLSEAAVDLLPVYEVFLSTLTNMKTGSSWAVPDRAAAVP